ncbi:hypothetical protein FGIG_05995 [Fasciola gigantica]|uniref:Uncharacterized protein n=1 Tax=Fasciola gigantica TaxID=46835 RepID=A0A504YE40_FASGI|nr:hypothetical protein FGIG_05995 [Fasciola gigantica]
MPAVIHVYVPNVCGARFLRLVRTHAAQLADTPLRLMTKLIYASVASEIFPSFDGPLRRGLANTKRPRKADFHLFMVPYS